MTRTQRMNQDVCEQHRCGRRRGVVVKYCIACRYHDEVPEEVDYDGPASLMLIAMLSLCYAYKTATQKPYVDTANSVLEVYNAVAVGLCASSRLAWVASRRRASASSALCSTTAQRILRTWGERLLRSCCR